MLDYSKAKEIVDKARGGRKKLQNNTYLESRPNGDVAVRLHGTDVVTYHPDGSFTLRTGGWHTVTTKDRINTYAPWGRVGQERGAWYFYPKRGDFKLREPFDFGIEGQRLTTPEALMGVEK